MRPWRRYQRWLYSGARNETADRIKRSAIVFAPHQDDETLGCGGSVILKRRAGTPVACVFMTDGSTSHRRFLDVEQLRSLRNAEAVEATQVLGVHREDVHFLGFPDGQLARFHEDAVIQVVALIERYRPDELYVPYRADGVRDHESTYAVVVDAVHKARWVVDVCEYPIWLWNQWPWVPLRIRWDREMGRTLTRLAGSGFGWRMLRECRTAVFVGDVLDTKRKALSHYRSQMMVLQPGTEWPTLGDVSGGEFLKWFFQDFEVFRCQRFSGRSKEPGLTVQSGERRQDG